MAPLLRKTEDVGLFPRLCEDTDSRLHKGDRCVIRPFFLKYHVLATQPSINSLSARRRLFLAPTEGSSPAHHPAITPNEFRN